MMPELAPERHESQSDGHLQTVCRRMADLLKKMQFVLSSFLRSLFCFEKGFLRLNQCHLQPDHLSSAQRHKGGASALLAKDEAQ